MYDYNQQVLNPQTTDEAEVLNWEPIDHSLCGAVTSDGFFSDSVHEVGQIDHNSKNRGTGRSQSDHGEACAKLDA